MKKIFYINLALVVAMLCVSACSGSEDELSQPQQPNPNVPSEEESEPKPMPLEYSSSNFYLEPTDALTNVSFEGTTSKELNDLIKEKSQSGGAIISIPKATYLWNSITLQSNILLKIEAGTIIKPENSSTTRIFVLGGTKASTDRLQNVSIRGDGGSFTVDISTSSFSNKKIVAFRVGRVNNFILSDFDIADRRSAVASICMVYVSGTTEEKPYPTNGVIQNISQTGAHTGYGLVQCYASDHVLFKNLNCHGGVTLRFETDDRWMKDEIKDGAKLGGVRNIFAYDIKGSNGITPLMFSPHFTTNGKVTVEKVVATGCCFAVRVEHGFVELFDVEKKFSTSSSTGASDFKNYIQSQFTLPSGTSATSGNAYKRNNGTQWAIRLSGAAIDAPRNAYVANQLGTLRAGTFAHSTVTNITAKYKSSGAKIKQAYLKYVPESQWSKLQNPGTSLGMGSGFEYHGPSLSLSYDNTTNAEGDGNYNVQLISETFEGFPAENYQNITYNSPGLSNNGPGTIPRYTAVY